MQHRPRSTARSPRRTRAPIRSPTSPRCARRLRSSRRSMAWRPPRPAAAPRPPATISPARPASPSEAAVRLGLDPAAMIAAWARADTHAPAGAARGVHPARHAVPPQHQQARRGLRLLRAHHLRVGAGRRRADRAEPRPDPRLPHLAPPRPRRPATWSTTRATSSMCLGVDNAIVHAPVHRPQRRGRTSPRPRRSAQVRRPDRRHGLIAAGLPFSCGSGRRRRAATAPPVPCGGR